MADNLAANSNQVRYFLPMPSREKLCESTAWWQKHIAGDENGRPQTILDRRLVAELDALKRLQAETAAELAALLPALLDRAFKGEL